MKTKEEVKHTPTPHGALVRVKELAHALNIELKVRGADEKVPQVGAIMRELSKAIAAAEQGAQS